MIGEKIQSLQPGNRVTLFENGDVDDIIQVILEASKYGLDFSQKFVFRLKGKDDHSTLKNVWQFVKRNIRYVRDMPGHEIIKSPRATWSDRYGDCKSHTVFVGSLLKHLGYNFKYRVAFYDPSKPEQGHIYTIAILPDGEEIIVDSVHHSFNAEHNYWIKEDYNPETGKRINTSALNGPYQFPRSGLISVGVGAAIIWVLVKLNSWNVENKLHSGNTGG